MTLTIPRAGNTAGRAPSVASTVEVSTTGTAVAQLGQAAQDVGQVMERDRLSREMQTAQTDMTRDLNQLRLETEGIGDPDEFEAVWAQGVQRIEASYLGDAGRLSVQNRADFQNRFNGLRDSMSFQLGMRGVGLRRSQSVANIAEWEHEAGLAAAGLDAAGRAELAAAGEAQIEAAVASGAMTPAQAQTRLLQMRGGLDAARAEALRENPAAMIEALDSGELDGVGGEEKERLRNRAIGQAQAMAANAASDNVAALNGYAIELTADDPELFLELSEQGLFASLPPETLSRHKVKADAEIQGRTEDTAEGRAIALLASNPAEYIRQADAGEITGLTPQGAARNYATAEKAIARQAEELAAEAERQEQARQREIGAQLADVVDLAKGAQGRAIALDSDFLSDPQTVRHEDYPKAMAAVLLHAEYPRLATRTPAELNALIEDERSRPPSEPYQAERLPVLEQARDAAVEGWSARPLDYAAEIGMEVPPLDIEAGIADPRQLSGQLMERQAFADALVQRGYTARPVVLSDEERAQLREATGADADPAERLALAQAANAAGMAPGAISDDRLFGYAQGSLGDGMAPTTVSRMLRGQAIIEERNIIMPPVADRLGEAHAHVAAFFADMPNGETLQAEVIEAADALYATQRRRSDPAGGIDTDVYRQALHEALGGTGRYDRASEARGGLQEVFGLTTLLPSGISGQEATDALRHLMRARSTSTLTEAGDLVQSGDDLTRRISSGGKVPMIDGQGLATRTIQNGRIVAVGPDTYELIWDTNRGPVTAATEDGDPWTFSLRRLVREAQQ